MLKVLRMTAPIGFLFGFVYALIAYTAGYLNNIYALVVIPFIAAALSVLGGIVASAMDHLLLNKGVANRRTRLIAGFLVAALVNCIILLIGFAALNELVLQRGIVLSILLGLGMGAVYGIYLNRMEQIKERMAFLTELAEKNRKLQEASRRLTITEERNRMGRDLHDSISQGLHGLVFSIHSLRNELSDPPPKVKRILEHMEAAAQATLSELRAMIEELKPSILAEQGLEKTLKLTTDLLAQRLEIPIDLEVDVPEKITPELEMTVFRISQEAVQNIEKHASAQHIYINVTQEDDILSLIIRDDGIGFNIRTVEAGNGLRNMRQRVEELGGTFQVLSKKGLGTSIIGRFPLKG